MTGSRTIIIFLITAAAAVAAFYGARSFIFSEIHAKIDEHIETLNETGLSVRYDTLLLSWSDNSIEIRQLTMARTVPDTACDEAQHVTIRHIRAEGFALFPLVFKGVLAFDSVYVDDAEVVLRKNGSFFPTDTTESDDDFVLSVEHGVIRSAMFTYLDSARCEPVTEVKTALTVSDLTLEFAPDKPFAYRVSTLTLDTTQLSVPKELYTFTMKQLRWNFLNGLLRIDSLSVIPQAGKIEFGRLRGIEIDRYDAVLPYIEARDFTATFIDSAAARASYVEMQLSLKVFRDKRRPFLKKEKLLPVHQIRALGLDLSIDSLKIKNSFVQYEEFAEDATEPALVWFDKLYASLYHISSVATTGETTVSVNADLMGQGDVSVTIHLPLDDGDRSRVKGTVSDFKLPELNTMLIPSTNLKVESGYLERLGFDFSYDAAQSTGKIELNYKDLKLAIFKDESDKGKKDEPEKDNLKTFIMNTFIFRTDMDEDVPKEKRTGTVSYTRDRFRSIFNFWVKSVVSGIQSAYNLDKAAAKESEREIRKEKRLARREARREKRAAKKRERG